MLKQLHRKYLADFQWTGINIGRHIVSYCEACGSQQVHYCIDKTWDQDKRDWLFTFECAACNERGA
jgi:hypothetical protein